MTPLRAASGSFVRSDRWLWLAVLSLIPLGLVMVASAAELEVGQRVAPEAIRQGLYGLAGLAAMVGASRIDYRWFQTGARVLFVGSLALLAAVIVVGVAQHGAQRWLSIGGMTLQPAEFAKLALAVALAAYGAERAPRVRNVLGSAGLLGLTAGLVLLQPDLGTVIVLTGTWLVFLIGWGVPWRTLAALVITGAAVGPLAFAVAIPGYQRERLAVFFDPSRDPLGSGFNLRQVEIALGAAGVTGHGLFSGAQSHLDSVAARSSDFMFGFLGAELGLLGGLLLLTLLALLVWRGFTAAVHASDAFGRLLAIAITGIVLVQGGVNVAVNLRLFPATGIPLPFISQGGSSLVVMLLCVGILQSIAARGQAPRR